MVVARRFRASSCGRSIPRPSTRLRPASARVSRSISATNGKTTTTAMAAKILGEHASTGVEPGRREPALRARFRARLRARRRARALRSGRGSAARGDPAHATACPVARQPVSRPARSLRRARARRRALAFGRRGPPRFDDADRQCRRPDSGGARGRTRGRSPLRARRSSSCATVAAARRGLEVLRALRPSLRVRGCVRRAPGRLPLSRLRARTTAARRRGTRDRARRIDRIALPAGHAARAARSSSCPCRGSTTSTTPSPPPRLPSRST